MAQDNYRKIKLLKLLELLRLGTDEQHPMTTSQICTRLDEMGIVCDYRINKPALSKPQCRFSFQLHHKT